MKNPCLINNKRDTMLTEKSKRYLVVGVVAAILLAIIVVFVIFEKERVAEIIQTGQQANPQTEPIRVGQQLDQETFSQIPDADQTTPSQTQESSIPKNELKVKAEYFMDDTPQRVRFYFSELEIGERFAVHLYQTGGSLYAPAFPVYDLRRYVGAWPPLGNIKSSQSLTVEYPIINGVQTSIPHYIAKQSSGWVEFLIYLPGNYGFGISSTNYPTIEFDSIDFEYWSPHGKYAENEFIIWLEELNNDKFSDDVAYVRAALYDSQGNPIVVDDKNLISIYAGYAHAYATQESEITVEYTPYFNSRVRSYSIGAQNSTWLYPPETSSSKVTHHYNAGNTEDYTIKIELGGDGGKSAYWEVILNYQKPLEKDPVDSGGTTVKKDEEILHTDWTISTTQSRSGHTVYSPNGNRFVAMSPNNGVEISNNIGSTWTLQQNSPTGLWRVASGGGKLVAVGPEKSAVSSDGGLTWTEHSQDNFPTAWSDLFYGNGKFVAINSGASGEIALFTSDDGIIWEDKTSTLPLNSYSSTFRPSKGAYGDGKYVLIGGIDIAYSHNNLQSWQLGGKEWGTTKTGITYGNGKFVIVTLTRPGSNYATGGKKLGHIMTSSDGNIWTVQETPDIPLLHFWTGAISYGGGKFVAIGSDPHALGSVGPFAFVSSNGINWYSENIFNNKWFVVYGGDRFVTTPGYVNIGDGRGNRASYRALRKF